MNKRKPFTLGILSTFMFFVLMSGVLGAITFITPDTAGDTVTGDYTFNVTTSLVNATNCTFSTTLNGAMNMTFNYTHSQVAFWSMNATASSLTDAEDTTLTVVCNNETTQESGTLTINVDNTAPVCSRYVDSLYTEYLSASGITITDESSDTTDLTWSQVLYGASGDIVQTSTSSNPTFSGSDISEIGEYTLSTIVTDEASKSTSCDNLSIFVTTSDNLPSGGSDVITTTTQETAKEGNRGILFIFGIILLAIIVVVIVAIFVINNSKKKRK